MEGAGGSEKGDGVVRLDMRGWDGMGWGRQLDGNESRE